MLRARLPLGLLAVVILARPTVARDKGLYDDKANAHQQLATALTEATKTGRNIVLIFGANW